jgi:hypothetical protein
MSIFQAIRAYFEAPLIEAYASLAPSIPVYVDNQEYADAAADSEFCLLSINFGATSEQALVAGFQRFRGSLVLEVYTAKGKGPGRGSELIAVGYDKLIEVNNYSVPVNHVMGSIGVVNGPTFSPLNKLPHFQTRLSTPISGRYYT